MRGKVFYQISISLLKISTSTSRGQSHVSFEHFSPLSIRRFSFVGGVTLSLTYGLPVRRFNDPLVRESKEVFETANATALPGKYLVNQLPWLQHIPDWMPFTGFKEDGRQIRRQLLNLMERPFNESLKRMVSWISFRDFFALYAHRCC